MTMVKMWFGALAALVVLVIPVPARAETVHATLTGYDETPLTLSTTANGRFRAHIDGRRDMIRYQLSYEDLEGDVAVAHIHLGRPAITGGVSAFLCGGGGKPACPGPHAGMVEGIIVPADVVGPAGQGIGPGEFDELVSAIRARATYVNVHSTKYPGGEIRGPIR